MAVPDPAAALDAFRAALNHCGFDQAAQDAVVAISGIAHIAMLGILAAADIACICKVIRTQSVDPVMITVMQEQLLQGMRYWVTNCQRIGLSIDADAFTSATAFAQTTLMTRLLEDEARADKDQVATMPEKFKKASEYKLFEESLDTYLGLLKGTGKIPLSYVIRHDINPDPTAVYQSENEQRIALAPLVGPEFDRDNAKVYGILKQLCLDGPGCAYVLPFDKAQNGRGAFLALREHYEQDSFRNRSKKEAYDTLQTIHYNGEKRGFTFEKFVQKHNEAFLELERQGEPVYEEKKVRDFLERISAPELQVARQQVLSDAAMMADFQRAANFISLSVPSSKQSTRYVASLETKGEHQGGRGRGRGGGRGRGRGRGRGCGNGGRARGQGGPNTTRYHTAEEWSKLTQEQRMSILEARGTKRNIGAIGTDPTAGAGGGAGGGNGAPPGDADGGQQQAGARQCTNAGDQFGAHAHVGMMRSSIRRSATRHPREISRAAMQNAINQNQEMYIELDSHADTVCVGANCRIIEYKQDMVNVESYHPQYKAMQNVAIVQAASAYDDPETGVTYILIFNQALDFTQSLPLTLVNPNQMRMNGLIIDDVPKHLSHSPDATHSIYVPEHDLHIKLQMRGVLSVWPALSRNMHLGSHDSRGNVGSPF